MIYFVTGGTGFIGKRLVRKLSARPNTTIYFLARTGTPEHIEQLRRTALYCGLGKAATLSAAKLLAGWSFNKAKLIPIAGDLLQPRLGVSKADIARCKDSIDHFFHLAAVYDLAAPADAQIAANIDGTRNALALAKALKVGHFHHFSSIAAAGLYEGSFREDMFEEAENLDNPYYQTKHDSEAIIRAESTLPWRIYRPAIVVGDSNTGEMDKIDGPYYFFKLIQRIRRALPQWAPMLGVEGGRLNIVPVNFVVDAVDHLAHHAGLDGQTFHLTDPTPMRVGELLNTIAKAAHAPTMSMFVNAALVGFIPQNVRKSVMALAPIRRLTQAIMKDLALPPDVMSFINYPTRFDSRNATRILDAAGITVPRFEDYAWRLWDYWERHLDPDLFVDCTLKGTIHGRIVLITGGSSGIGKAAAFQLAEAGAVTLIIGRDQEKLDATLKEAAQRGLTLYAYSCDVGDAVQCADLVRAIEARHGAVDVLVNNAGRSIRRAIESSFDRFHDFERTMQVNYFGCLRLTMGLLPGMIAKRNGHVINISSIGVLTNAPRFSAYVASKAALEAWTRCAASELADRGISFTTINMPLVRTPMIAPTRMYDHAPALTPEQAADMITEAIVRRPVRIATRLGVFGQMLHALLPRAAQISMNTAFRMFPDSDAAKGGKDEPPTAEQVALAQLMRGIHF